MQQKFFAELFGYINIKVYLLQNNNDHYYNGHYYFVIMNTSN